VTLIVTSVALMLDSTDCVLFVTECQGPDSWSYQPDYKTTGWKASSPVCDFTVDLWVVSFTMEAG